MDTLLHLVENEIPFIDWPSMSPDLNPIENIWSRMKTLVERELPRTKQELVTAINKVWDSFDHTKMKNYVHSMHDRLSQCITLNGEITSY